MRNNLHKYLIQRLILAIFAHIFIYMQELEDFKTVQGNNIYSYEFIQQMRAKEADSTSSKNVFAQAGCQEKFLATHADLTIFGGSRGGGKSFALLIETLKDVYNPYFNAVILREEKPDLENLIDESNKIFEQYGKYNRSKDDMTWNFHAGGKLHFGIYSQAFSDFQKKYQGKQYAYIGIDEITHMPYKKFKYLMTDNRNAHGIRNRVYGTCNPDPDSWVRKFIDWWIGDDGFPIPERDGVIRYCFMEGNTPNSIIWGDTPEEVYLQCKRTIDGLWKPAYAKLGFDKLTMFIKSVCFIYGKLEENIKLLSSDPNYIANLAQQDEEQRGRDLSGNWDIRAGGDDIISRTCMERFYSLPQNIEDQGRKRVSCDVAFTGGDSLVMWLWDGWHMEDVFVCRNDAKMAVDLVKA